MPAKRTTPSPAEMLKRLESRHEDLLGRIDDLNQMVELALEEVTDAGEGTTRPDNE